MAFHHVHEMQADAGRSRAVPTHSKSTYKMKERAVQKSSLRDMVRLADTYGNLRQHCDLPVLDRVPVDTPGSTIEGDITDSKR